MKMNHCIAAAGFLSLTLLCTLASSHDGRTLLEVKKSFRDDNNVLCDWTNTTLSAYCSWSGVTCDNVSFSVIALNLSNLGLGGEISSAIGSLKGLRSMGLRGNNLRGSLSPDICQLTGLWYFDVRNNSLSGNIPPNIGNCTSLQVLDLSYNKLTGEIPFNIGFLQVATLSLQGNYLSGTIPPVIGLMQALAVLDLSCNFLTGTIPSILGNLSYTEKLYLQGNTLTGIIPPELGNMTKLHYLELGDNQLTGYIPLELGSLSDLFSLNLANNNLEGPIPGNLSMCINLNTLNMCGNRLSGRIPQVFEKLERMTYLNLSSNTLTGPIPIEISKIGNLDTLDLSDNEINGPIPASIGDLEHLLKLNLSNNHLFGYIPAEFGNLRSVVDIDLSRNHLSGTIPQEIGQLQNLFLLKIDNNNLSGGILPLFTCISLTVINVSYNNLAGKIPRWNNFSRFPPDSFLGNPGLCGDWPGSPCFASYTSGRASLSKATIGAIAFGSVAIAVGVFMAVCRQNKPVPPTKGSPCKQAKNVSPKLVIHHMNMALHVYEDIMQMTENLSEKYVIGYGASSIVYKCTLKNCHPVAIKRLYYQYPQNLKEFETELKTIGSIKHRNLVSLQGYSLSPLGNLLFYDYMENGSLWDHLHVPSKKRQVDWKLRLQIALGAATGLAYLHHDCRPRIIHRDVKSSNILLDKDFEAHLTDFGIAKCLCTSKTHTSTCIMGTIGYIDPEYARTSRLTEKSDVYSFGIVLLELLTGRKAVDDDCNLLQLILSKTADNAVMETADPAVTMTCKDSNDVKKAFQLALLCTRRQPTDRPSMHEVSRVLQSMVSVAEPPKQVMAIGAPPCLYDKLKNPQGGCAPVLGTSDANVFLRFEVISQNAE